MINRAALIHNLKAVFTLTPGYNRKVHCFQRMGKNVILTLQILAFLDYLPYLHIFLTSLFFSISR